ncbi:MAG: hypothetical protein JWM93_1725 [Frankiales bacterium]|nr:hypothetical protein [Frankiales bacterium]
MQFPTGQDRGGAGQDLAVGKAREHGRGGERDAGTATSGLDHPQVVVPFELAETLQLRGHVQVHPCAVGIEAALGDPHGPRFEPGGQKTKGGACVGVVGGERTQGLEPSGVPRRDETSANVDGGSPVTSATLLEVTLDDPNGRAGHQGKHSEGEEPLSHWKIQVQPTGSALGRSGITAGRRYPIAVEPELRHSLQR